MHPLAYCLGFGGLTPFFFFAAQHSPNNDAPPWGDRVLARAGPSFASAFAACDQGTVRRRFATYSACILSFLGAVHMGHALTHAPPTMRTRVMLCWSVCPSLMAWGALNTAPVEGNAGKHYVLLGGGFLVALAADRLAALPTWYLQMRLPLTALVVASHAVATALS